MVESPNHWWQNWPKTHAFVAEKMFFPTSADEIALAIQRSEADRRPLRAIGGGWSFSDASLPGAVTTNRPKVHAVEAIAAVVPQAERFPSDRSLASVAGVTPMPVPDLPSAMVMLDEAMSPPAADTRWVYLGGGRWINPTGQLQGAAGDPPGFLHWLAGAKLRPIRNPAGRCVDDADAPGSMVMFDLNENSTVASRDWAYKGGGVWVVGVSPDSAPRAPEEGSLQDLAAAGRLVRPGGMNLSPRAADPAAALALLLAKTTATPAGPEPAYLLNTRSLVSSLQQKLPGILSASALDATSETPSTGSRRFFFHVEAGITIAELGSLLAHQSPRLSIQAISGSPGASLAGALATATHGAEFNWPLVIDRVKAVHLVGPGGVQWWIEGDESIADPLKLRAAYPGIAANRIVRGGGAVGGVVPHDWLGASVVSLGCLGVVYSIVLEVVPQFGVREVVVQRTWKNVGFLGTRYAGTDVETLLRTPATAKDVSGRIVKLMQAGNLNGTGIPQVDAAGKTVNQYADLAINPIRRTDGDFDCWVGNRELTAQLPLDAQHGSDMLQGIARAFAASDPKVKLGRVFGLGNVEDTARLVADIAANFGRFKAMLGRVARARDLVDVALDTALAPMSRHPDGTVAAQTLLSGILAGLLNTANCDKRSDVTGVSVGALGFPAAGVMGTALEIAISPADAFGFIQTEILDKVTPQKPFYGYVSIRLCSRTQTLLGMQQFGDAANPCSVMIEVVGFANDDAREFMQNLQQRTVTLIAGGLDAMLHWGLENDALRGSHLRATKALQAPSRSGMSKLNTFKAVRSLLHAAAPAATFRVFDNAFTERLELSAPIELAFVDAQRTPIAQWLPTPILAQPGTPLFENVASYLEDLHLLNRSNRAIQVDEVRIASPADAPGAPVFKVLTPRPFTIGIGQLFPLELKYIGAPAGPLGGVVEVECDRPIGPTVSIGLATSVTPNRRAHLEWTPASIDLGSTGVGTTIGRNLTLTNTGTYTANFASIAVTLDQPPGQFGAPVVLPAPLQPGQSDTVYVSYSPDVHGAAQATLAIDVRSRTDIASVEYRHRLEVPLTATSHAPMLFVAAGPQRWAILDGVRIPVRDRALRTLDFGTAPPATLATASFWIRNVGDAPLTVRGVVSYAQASFSDTNPAQFPTTLPPAGEIEVPCNFLAPTTPGASAASTFRLLTDDPRQAADPGFADFAVTGRAAGAHLADPNELLELGSTPPLSLSATLFFRSDGTDPVQVKKVTLAQGSAFSASSGAPMQLPPGSDLTVTVTLTATQPGNYQDQLIVIHNGSPAGNSQVLLRGNVT